MSTVKLKVVRALMYRAKRCEVGDIVTVGASEASAMTATGRCELLDAADAKLIHDAGRAELRQQLRQQPAPQLPPGPWLSVNH